MSNVSQGSQQYTTINDFTPGVQRFSRGGYAPTYPLAQGSAASAYRCYAQPGIGLCPLPAYTAHTLATAPSGGDLVMASIVSVGAWLPGQEILYAAVMSSPPAASSAFIIYPVTGASPGVTVGSAVYSVTGSATPLFRNNMTACFTDDGTYINIVGVITDMINGILVTVPSWDSAANHATVSPGALAEGSPTFTQSSRVGFFNQTNAGSGATPVAVWGVVASDLPSPAGTMLASFNPVEFFNPSNSNQIGAWGSINAGELVLINTGQGASLVYGDVAFPSAVINLPGVNGTGQGYGPAISTPVGLVYPTDYDGAYVWNGGETSQKISSQIPDDQLLRTVPGGGTAQGVVGCSTHHDVWANWVMFANNWMYDCLTNAWWQVEDPTVANFQVHAASHATPRFFYSTDGFSAPTTVLHIYQWDRSVPQSNYVWTSNPIAQAPGYLVTLNSVEVVVSNPSATPATVTVTPTVPAGQTPLGTSAPQSVSFTIPPTTTAARQSSALGYTDFNVEISVVASNSNGSNQAPIIHEIIVGWEASTTSGSGA